MDKLNAKIPAELDQIIGFALGVIFCAWWVDATSEQVAAIRLPAVLITVPYMACVIVAMAHDVAVNLRRKHT